MTAAASSSIARGRWRRRSRTSSPSTNCAPRSRSTICPEPLGVMAVWDGAGLSEFGLSYADPRLPALGSRTILPPDLVDRSRHRSRRHSSADAEAYDAHRIALGVPRGGEDFIYGDAFPHEADMDQLGGVDFDKGCYVGQEVVSRVEHRGSARSRIVPVAYEFAPASGQPVMAGEKEVGTLMSTAKGHGLAHDTARPRRRCARRRHAATVRQSADAIGEAGLGDASPGRARRKHHERRRRSCRRPEALPVAEAGPALRRLSRRGMGRAGMG